MRAFQTNRDFLGLVLSAKSTVRIFSVGLFLLSIYSIGHIAWADSGTEDIAIRSFNSTGDGLLSLKTQRLTLFILWILVVGIFTVGVLSSSSHYAADRLKRLGKAPDASNLFLGIQYSVVGEPAIESGFVRSLGMRRAMFVSSRPLAKNSRVRIDFATLPGFDGADQKVEAVVLKSKAMSKDQKHFQIDVRFEAMADSVRLALDQYLHQLTSPQRNFQRV